jgi:HD domain-containing protein
MDPTRLLPVPSPATRAAAEVADRYQTTSLFEHCSRSYLWAASLGEQRGLEIDRELLYVAAMLHDLGLSPAFDNVTNCFETAGGDLAWVFAAGSGWTQQRRDHARTIIVAHMWDEPPSPAEDPESYLLNLATGFDIAGRNPELWPTEMCEAVLGMHPRHQLADEFTRLFADQAGRKPGCAAAASIRAGLAQRIAANPLDR